MVFRQTKLYRDKKYWRFAFGYRLFYFDYVGKNLKLKMIFEKIFFMPKCFFSISTFYNYVFADEIYNCLYTTKKRLKFTTSSLN